MAQSVTNLRDVTLPPHSILHSSTAVGCLDLFFPSRMFPIKTTAHITVLSIPGHPEFI